MTDSNLMSRRLFLVAAGTATLAACGSSVTRTAGSSTVAGDPTTTPTPSSAASAATSVPVVSDGFNALWIPPLLEGTSFDLTLAPSTATLLDGKSASTISYNGGQMWGPTMVMRKGDSVTVNVTNDLDEDTTTHWHGVHLPPDMDGGPHQVIAAGDTWSPTWTVKNNAATYWYHPHAHELTWPQLSMGAGGFIIVQDDDEAALALPAYVRGRRHPARAHQPHVRRQRPDRSPKRSTVTICVANGVLNAEVELPAQLVRFRILNAEIERGLHPRLRRRSDLLGHRHRRRTAGCAGAADPTRDGAGRALRDHRRPRRRRLSARSSRCSPSTAATASATRVGNRTRPATSAVC